MVRRVYPVFQDRNWTARPWVIEDEHVSEAAGGFRVRAAGRGSGDAASLRWRTEIDGLPDGTVRMVFEGESSESFLRNRLGLCVLHPIRTFAGTSVMVEHADGSIEQSAFPSSIAPNQPFLAMRAIRFEPVAGAAVTVRMEGEVFESEDHRNWSDASIKHYCTPISLPFPVQVRPGDAIRQVVTIRLDGTAEPPPPAPLRISVSPVAVALPRLGIQLDHDGHRLSRDEIALLRGLQLAHVRVDLGPSDGPERLDGALADAEAIGARLVVALDGADPERFAGHRDHPVIDRWLLFDPRTPVTDPAAVERAQGLLGPRVAGGTNRYFTELNRGRPESRGFIAFSANPQVHAWDDETVMQNAWTLGPIARQARALYPTAFLELSPLTLRPRWNPNATEPALDVSSTPLPSRVDARQCTAFAAAWTVLALSSLTADGALDAVTLFAATGWEGLVERAGGSPQPTDFPSTPGAPFPVYDVLRRIAGATSVRPAHSTDPDRAGALVLGDGSMLVANATPRPQHPIVDGRPVDLPPYGVVVIDAERTAT